MSSTAITSVTNQSSTADKAPQAQDATLAIGGQPGVLSAAKQQLNTQILEASAKVSIQSGNKSQALVFRAAIDRINELLAPEFGANAIQGRMTEDNSPEATAGRILSLSTGFFDAYAAQHPDTPPEQLARDFVNLIRGGFEKGFKDASDILDGLQGFSGEIKDGIMKTYELVSKGYDDFLASKLQAVSEPKVPATAAY